MQERKNKVNNARYINQDVVNLYLSAGIDPKTGNPLKLIDAGNLKAGIKKLLRIKDEQDAVNRYQWWNYPVRLTSQEVERLIYYRGNLMLFYYEEMEQFLLLPYALDGNIDFYGRYLRVRPVPYADGSDDVDKKEFNRQIALLSGKSYKVLYDIPTEPIDNPLEYCVLLYDFTKQWAQTNISRQILQEPILDVMSDCIPFLRTALIKATGISGVRVDNEDAQSNVTAAAKKVYANALTGIPWVSLVNQIEMQELDGGNPAIADEFLMSLQALDNFRLEMYGLENGGIFEKKQYQNMQQTALNGTAQVGSPLQDGLAIRQRHCDLANYLWGIGCSCTIQEQATNMDMNLDGMASDQTDQTGMGQGDNSEVVNNG